MERETPFESQLKRERDGANGQGRFEHIRATAFPNIDRKNCFAKFDSPNLISSKHSPAIDVARCTELRRRTIHG
jgi:hypothetical protein